MTEQTAGIIWLLIAAYCGIGVCVAVAALLRGLRILDAGAAAMPLRVRLLIAPGLTALWPLVIARLRGLRAKEDKR